MFEIKMNYEIDMITNWFFLKELVEMESEIKNCIQMGPLLKKVKI